MFGTFDALIYFASFLVRYHGFKIGQFSTFLMQMFSLQLNFATLSMAIGEVMAVFGTMAAISEIYIYEPKIPIEGGDSVTQASIEDGSIRLEQIEFTYPTKQEIQVLQKIDIEVTKNRTVALVGSSGCGKSTII
jgi:ABC-type bacteriocin/lantibiotic exporter with double-glycine peptidase domain